MLRISASLLRVFSRSPHVSLSFKLSRSYERMSPEDYLFNQREAAISTKVHEKKLLPLPLANHSEGSTDEIALYGVPNIPIKEDFPEYDTFRSALTANHPDLIFLQVNPGPYLARQRFLAHKCALKGVEDYEINGLRVLDPVVPDSWEECVVNLVTLDMMKKNKAFTELDYTEGFATYSYPYLQSDQKYSSELTKPLIENISQNILSTNISPYPIINQALFKGLLGKQKVMLGDMPEPLLRQIVGNTVGIEEMRELFRLVLKKMEETERPMSMKEATLMFLPHIFQIPKDLYMTALLKEAFQAATCVVAFVGLPHFNPIQRYWQGPPTGITYSQATKIPDRIRGETDEFLIEKQAMMEVLMDSRVWGAKYLSNPFPYILEDITKATERDLSGMKKCFAVNYNKYLAFRNKKLQEIGATKTAAEKLLEKSKETENLIKLK